MHRRFGSLPLVAGEGRVLEISSFRVRIPNMLK